jgi:hypothetical protein
VSPSSPTAELRTANGPRPAEPVGSVAAIVVDRRGEDLATHMLGRSAEVDPDVVLDASASHDDPPRHANTGVSQSGSVRPPCRRCVRRRLLRSCENAWAHSGQHAADHDEE